MGDHKYIWKLLLLALLLNFAEGCPKGCICSYNDSILSVDCSNNNISSIPSEELSNNTEVLKFSNNKLTSLHYEVFTNLRELQELHLVANLLRRIEEDTFSALRSLTLIDLSCNAIEYIHPEAFSKNVELQMLYLKGNELSTITENFIISSSVNLLDLSNCQIRNLSNKAFDAMTSLHNLYLRHNKLQALDELTYNKLTNLNKIDLDGNQLSCGNCDLLDKLCTLSEKTNLTLNLPKCTDPITVVGLSPVEAKREICSDKLRTENNHLNCSKEVTTFVTPELQERCVLLVTSVLLWVVIVFIILVSVGLVIFLYRKSCERQNKNLEQRDPSERGLMEEGETVCSQSESQA